MFELRWLLLAVSAVAAVQLPARATLPLPVRLPCGCLVCGGARDPLLFSSSEGSELPQPTQAAMASLQFYKRFISPLIPPSCRFIPTCSEYGQECFEQFTVPQSVVLIAWRLLRCNPLHWPGTGFGNDAPVWPPPVYWSGDGTLRTFVDDDRSRRKALGEDVDATLPYDPLGLNDDDEDGGGDATRADGSDAAPGR